MRILLWAPWPGGMTGYCRLTDNFGRRLSKMPGVELAYFSYSHIVGVGGIIYEGCPVFTAPHEWYGQARHFVAEVNLRFKPDIILQIFDLFTAMPTLKNYGADMPLISYSPQDAVPLAQTPWEAAKLCKGIIPQTNFAKRLYNESAVNTLDVLYHGVDSVIYHPRSAEANAKTRTAYGIDADAFMVLMVQDNTRRKNIPNQIKAWCDFRRATKAKTNLLGVIPDMRQDREHDLQPLWDSLKDSPTDSGFTWTSNLSEDELAALYAAADVLLQCPHSEGFGLPIIEAGCCATPTIGTNFASIPELIESRGWLVDGELSFHIGNSGSGLRLEAWQLNPSLQKMTDALISAHEDPMKRKVYGERMRLFTLANCNWDSLTQQLFRSLTQVYEHNRSAHTLPA